MTALLSAPTQQPQAAAKPAEVSLTLHNVSWDLYERLRDESEGQNVRLTYDAGRLVIMAPLPRHDRTKTLIGSMFTLIALEWDIPICSLGSTTWKRKDLAKGLEADECYYVRHEAQVRGKEDFDLTRDPPPDLAVEVDITSDSTGREPVYAALGVNELWRFDGERTTFLKLGPDRQYHPIDHSDAFPRIRPDDIDRCLRMYGTTDETSIFKAFRDWLRANR